MARYTGAVCKQCRRENLKLSLKGEKCVTEKCPVEKKPYPPGEHGRRRTKESQYYGQLREKQRAKRMYGILEKQFRNYYEDASHKKGITGENLLQVLETRLDNIIYRAGFAASRAEARQLIRHGSTEVNGRKVNIPSAQLKPGSKAALRGKVKESNRLKAFLASPVRPEVPGWLVSDDKNLSVEVKHIPSRDEISVPIREQLIVELYSK